jgi:benzodiazapine receptor
MKRKKPARSSSAVRRFDWRSLVFWIVLCELAGIVGSVFTATAIPTWYQTLTRPSFSPPNWLFGPVWITLYLLMGIAIALVRQRKNMKGAVQSATTLFVVHLAANAVWSPIFFGAKNIPLAFINIGFIWVSLILLIFRFYAIEKKSAYLLLPYLAWISFATVLNYHFWLLNP